MNGISVDRDFARFGAKSYAINKINSIEIRQVFPNKEGGAIISGGVALVSAIVGFNIIGENPGGAIAAFAFAAFLCFVARNIFIASKIIEYQLFLMTSSSEVQAFVTRDEESVVALRDRIEAAMAGRL